MKSTLIAGFSIFTGKCIIFKGGDFIWKKCLYYLLPPNSAATF
jgi:hypothetical protein